MSTVRKFVGLILGFAVMAYLLPGAAFAQRGGGQLKLFYGEPRDANGVTLTYVQKGDPILVRIFISNTSTEPATINTLVVCNTDNIKFKPGAFASGPTGQAILYTGIECSSLGGVLIKDIVGLRRGDTATYQLTANVTGTCSDSAPERLSIYASTGNTTSFTPNFFATTGANSSEPLPGPVTYSSTQVVPGCDGVIQCGQAVPLVDTNGNSAFDPWEPGQAKSIRQLWNSNGASCQLVPYDFTNAILSDGTVVLRWPTAPTSSQRAAVFRTEATGKAKLLPDTTQPYPTSGQVDYAWEFNPDGTPKWITPGLMCLDQEYPRPYATLVANLSAGALAGAKFDVSFNGVNPGGSYPNVTGGYPAVPGITPTYYDPAGWKPLPLATVPFELTIGDERIRVKVFSVSGTSATLEVVERAVWGTGPPLTHAAGAFLLSVVMPADMRDRTTVNGAPNAENPYYQKVVRMCTISHGIRMYIPKPDNPNAQKSQYFEFVDFFDGDGWGRVQ